MMLLLLKRQLSHLLFPCSSPCRTTLISSSHHLLTSFSTTATIQNPSPKPPFIVEYLVNSCGFSPDKALEASKHLTHIESPAKPDSVLRFLKQRGLGDAHIRSLLSMHPELLRSNVEKTLKPKFRALQELGFSEAELIQLVSECPNVLRASNLRPKFEFWRSLFGPIPNSILLKAIAKHRFLLTSSLSKKIIPNVSLLQECSIPDDRIAKMILQAPRLITKKSISIKAAIKRTEELGVPRSSGMFRHVFRTVFSISRATLDAKFRFLQSLGWSESEALSAIQKVPALMRLSEKRINESMEFLLKEVGHKISYIACTPVLLTYSLEKRLIPRHRVLRTLKQKKMLWSECNLCTAVVVLSDEKFIEKFIVPYKKKIQGLHEAYVSACAGKIPSQCKD